MRGWGLIILAGGEGRRIGGNKPDVHLKGRRLIDIAQSFAQGFDGPKVVSVRETDQIGGLEYPSILDDELGQGPISGVLSGFGWAQANKLNGFVTVPCDAPYLPTDLFTRLIKASEKLQKPAAASSNGQVHPVCAAWPVSFAERIRAYANDGRRSLHGALEASEASNVDWEVVQTDPFTNINTLEELRRLE